MKAAMVTAYLLTYLSAVCAMIALITGLVMPAIILALAAFAFGSLGRFAEDWDRDNPPGGPRAA
ncbi:hypothetical protein [Agromyces larvae]|uniref:DUF4229 domain-containing protein n=1 Tax=Agromyces larvae TaxID=2929802 RepID=A0ABY4CB99_9MICO|nr:hypothetical protein [Agromyces larvae]UOE45970.1 hypothetical protein MTO99_09575 [Agromyces larvae]